MGEVLFNFQIYHFCLTHQLGFVEKPADLNQSQLIYDSWYEHISNDTLLEKPTGIFNFDIQSVSKKLAGKLGASQPPVSALRTIGSRTKDPSSFQPLTRAPR